MITILSSVLTSYQLISLLVLYFQRWGVMRPARWRGSGFADDCVVALSRE
jgi:hypothetical protein